MDPENIPHYKELGQSLKLRRESKEAAIDINLRVRRSEELNQILQSSDDVLAGMEEEQHEWINEKIANVSEYLQNGLSNNWRQRLEEAYRGGLNTTISQEYRLQQNSLQDVQRLHSPEYIRQVIQGYTIDFYRTLLVAKKKNVGSGVALKIAEKSYRLDPNALLELSQRYPDVNIGVITHALPRYQDPDNFIRSFIEKKTSLLQNPDYQDIPPSIIEKYLLKHFGDEDPIRDRYKAKKDQLLGNPHYKNLPSSILDTALLSTSNPEALLDDMLDKLQIIQSNPACAQISIFALSRIILHNSDLDAELLTQSMENVINLLNRKGFTNQANLISQSAQFFAYNITEPDLLDEQLTEKITTLENLNFPSGVRIIQDAPRLLQISGEDIKERVDALRERGFSEPVKFLSDAPSTLGLNIKNIDRKITALRRLIEIYKLPLNPITVLEENPYLIGSKMDKLFTIARIVRELDIDPSTIDNHAIRVISRVNIENAIRAYVKLKLTPTENISADFISQLKELTQVEKHPIEELLKNIPDNDVVKKMYTKKYLSK